VLQRSKEGTFLVRFSKTVPVGSYSLVYKYLDYDASELRLAQVRILRRGTTYLIDDEQFKGNQLPRYWKLIFRTSVFLGARCGAVFAEFGSYSRALHWISVREADSIRKSTGLFR
jgi:hypothetical protein